MSSKTEIPFTGDIVPARCECHTGKFMGRAFIVHPVAGQILIGHTFFDDMPTAEKHLEGFVAAVAQDHLKKIGLSIETSTDVRVHRDKSAVEAVTRFMAENNPNASQTVH